MPRDHYIAQTYLKHFIDPKLKSLLHAYRKSDLKHFTPTTKDICVEENWDSNPYFQEPRAVDQFLKLIEPKWNRGVNDIAELLRYEEVKFFMAGYIAVMASCSPTARKNMPRILHHGSAIICRRARTSHNTSNTSHHQNCRVPEIFATSSPMQDRFEHRYEKLAAPLTATVDPKAYSHGSDDKQFISIYKQWLLSTTSPWMELLLINEPQYNRTQALTSDFCLSRFIMRQTLELAIVHIGMYLFLPNTRY